MYILFGLGFFSWFNTPSVGMVFSKIVAILCLIVGILAMRQLFLKPGLAPAWAVRTKKIVLSSGGMAVFGVVAGLLSLAKVSVMFTTLRTLSALDIGKAVVVPMILFYVVVYVLPLIALLLILAFLRQKMANLAFGKEPHNKIKEEIWRNHYHRVFDFVVGLLLFILGIIVLLS
jgi:hypothetical protein